MVSFQDRVHIYLTCHRVGRGEQQHTLFSCVVDAQVCLQSTDAQNTYTACEGRRAISARSIVINHMGNPVAVLSLKWSYRGRCAFRTGDSGKG